MSRLTPLAVAFVALGALVVWRESTRGGVRNLAEEADLRAFAARTFTSDDVSKIEVTAPGGDAPEFSLVREDKGWRALGAFKAPASGGAVTKLLDALAKAEGEFRSDDKAALEQFGLSKAKAVGVRVLDKDGKELVHLAVGATANQRGAFVRDLADGADDSKAYSIASDVRGLLGLPRTSVGAREPDRPAAAHFHDKEFPQLAVEKPTRVELSAPGRVVAFEKAATDAKEKPGEWKVAAGGPDAPFKKEVVDIVLKKLGGSFHPTGLVDPAKKKELGLDEPKYRLSVTTESGPPRVVVASTDAACEHFYVRLDAAQDPEVVYEANEYEFHQLFPTGSSMFELPKVEVGKDKDAPTRIVVERKGRETIEIQRGGTKPTDDWLLMRPAWPLATKQSALRGVSTQPGAVNVVDYVDDAQAPEPEVVVRYGASGVPDDQLKTISIGGKAPAGKDRLATLSAKPGRVFVVAENILERLAPEPLSLFETKILHDWKRDDVTAVRIAGGAEIVRAGDEWKTGAEKAVAEISVAAAWLDALFTLEVKGVVPAGEGETFTSLVIERREGAPLALQIGPAADGKRVVKIGEFRATVADMPGLLPDAASLLPKQVEPPKTDEPKKDDEKK